MFLRDKTLIKLAEPVERGQSFRKKYYVRNRIRMPLIVIIMSLLMGSLNILRYRVIQPELILSSFQILISFGASFIFLIFVFNLNYIESIVPRVISFTEKGIKMTSGLIGKLHYDAIKTYYFENSHFNEKELYTCTIIKKNNKTISFMLDKKELIGKITSIMESKGIPET